jgi:serine protease Do
MIKKILVLLLSSFVFLPAEDTVPPSEQGAEIFKKVDPTVVAIQIEKAGGSGLIISADGYIITNGHVISDGTKEDPLRVSKRITVILSDETKYSAKVIGHSLDPDVALIKIEPKKPLSVVTFFDSSKAQTGQKCYALGMPIGHKRTLTSGIISNTERVLGTFTSVFQTDAAINPGNSGGPLFNENGEVLGINTYAGGGQNMGFTIPANVVVILKDHFLKFGYFKKAIVPFFFTQNIYDELGEALGVPNGVIIDYVDANSQAYKDGMRNGDIVLEKNGKKVTVRTLSQLLQFEWEMATQEIGSDLQLKLLRKVNNENAEITFISKMIEDEPAPAFGYQKGEIKELTYQELGLGVQPTVRMSRFAYGITEPLGVFVSQSVTNFPASRAGLIPNPDPDLITHINNIPITNLQVFEEQLTKALKEKQNCIVLKITRGKFVIETALKPTYKLAGKSVAIIVTTTEPQYWEEITKFAMSTGANTKIFSKSGEPFRIPPANFREKEILVKAHESFEKLNVSEFDSIILLDGNQGNKESESEILKYIKEANVANKTIAAVGSRALLLLQADEKIKTKKITTNEASSETALSLNANYTGKDLESDGNIITTTGRDVDIIKIFLSKWKSEQKK